GARAAADDVPSNRVGPRRAARPPPPPRRRALSRRERHPAAAVSGARGSHHARPRGVRVPRDVRAAAALALPPVRPAQHRARGAARGWTLAIAGRLRPGYAPDWTASPPAGVRWLGQLDDADLIALYRAAAVVVSASEY